MKIFEILTNGTIFEKIGKATDSLFTSDEERLEKKIELQKAKNLYKLENKKAEFSLITGEMQETSKRWVSDNQGNFITRSVRPLTLIFLLVVITSLAILDGNNLITDFEIKSGWVSLFETLTMVVFGAFFGGKTIERLKKVG